MHKLRCQRKAESTSILPHYSLRGTREEDKAAAECGLMKMEFRERRHQFIESVF